jgi:hypothetical protein
MFKKCKYCKYCYCGDESNVSNMDCRKNKTIKITDLDRIHIFCSGFKPSLLKILLGI